MAALPLLTLPSPKLIKPASRAGFGGSRPPVPIDGQRQRIPAQFAELQKALNERRLELGDNIAGIEPGQVLVLETNCPIEDFSRAIQQIRGLEWLGEEIGDDIEEDPEDTAPVSPPPQQTDFFSPRPAEFTPDAPSTGHLYLAFTNQTALGQLEAMWKQYAADQEQRFPDGLAPLRNVFKHLINIRPWDAEDRLRESGLQEDWQERIQAGAELVPVEIELWYRQAASERCRRRDAIRQRVLDEGGSIVVEHVLDSIRYHALLVRLPIAAAQRIIEHDYTRLIKSDEIMFFRAVGQIAGPPPAPPDENAFQVEEVSPQLPLSARPRIALLDGLPLENHVLLSGRLVVDDPDDWGEDYQAKERQHGTAMASIILRGELDGHPAPLPAPLYVRPILKPNSRANPRPEETPDDVLVVDLVYRALRRMFEGEGDGDAKTAPVAPDVVIVNLSVGDPHRPFLGRMLSPWARLLDWAAWEYKVLFCVSAGNYKDSIKIRMSPSLFRTLPATDHERNTLITLHENQRHRRLLSPAEAINALTVGAAHADSSQPRPNERQIDVIATPSTVSPISGQGPGFRRSVKPDFLLPGGRVLFDTLRFVGAGDETPLVVSNQASPPGHRVAVPGVQPGELDRTGYIRGTSNAAALASRAAAQCLSVLDDLLPTWGDDGVTRAHQPPMLKAMLAHTAAWTEQHFSVIKSLFANRPDLKAGDIQEVMTQLYGYGVAEPDRVLACADQRATLLGCGSLGNQETHEYRVPLPPSLAGQMVNRRLIVTLAWLSPLNVDHRRYRGAKVAFELKKPEGSDKPVLQLERDDVNHQAVRRGTVQHEVFCRKPRRRLRRG